MKIYFGQPSVRTLCSNSSINSPELQSSTIQRPRPALGLCHGLEKKQILGNQKNKMESSWLSKGLISCIAIRSLVTLSNFISPFVPVYVFSLRCRLCGHSAWDQHVPVCFVFELVEFLSRSRRARTLLGASLIHLIVKCRTQSALLVQFLTGLISEARFLQ